ncbi:ATP-grasp domain-containing protein [Candidatus Dojkabacteria bacterium]|nr:ATP-grasp domain-containing protein [Candidatus Dojkabacteria bacterium]
MIKRYTKNINFDLYLNAAHKLGIKYNSIIKTKNIGYFEKNGKRLVTLGHWIGINNAISHIFATKKYISYQLLAAKGLPHPKAKLIEETCKFVDIEKLSILVPKPWVVKPLKGSEGKGVSVKLTKGEDLKKAVDFARQIHKTTILEEYVEGNHFRILVFRGKIIDIVKRIPAYVVGNGKDSIKQLIEKKNSRREKAGMAAIRVDEELLRQLKEQKLSIDSIVGKKVKVELRKNCNLCAGGETKRIRYNHIHKDNLKMFIEAVKALELDLGGIDFITPDISESFHNVKCAINEINKAPMGNVHYFADMELNNFTSKEILTTYFNL